MFLAQFLLKKKTFFLSASALIFFPRNGVTWMTTRQRDNEPLKKPSQHAQVSTSSPGTIYSTTRPKPLKKPSGGTNLQSSQKIWISGACEMKLGCVLSFLENAIRDTSPSPSPLPFTSPQENNTNYNFVLYICPLVFMFDLFFYFQHILCCFEKVCFAYGKKCTCYANFTE